MIINLLSETLIGTHELFYIGKLKMTNMNFKAPNMKWKVLYMCRWKCDHND